MNQEVAKILSNPIAKFATKATKNIHRLTNSRSPYCLYDIFKIFFLNILKYIFFIFNIIILKQINLIFFLIKTYLNINKSTNTKHVLKHDIFLMK